jgi:Fe-S-cluster containining protein
MTALTGQQREVRSEPFGYVCHRCLRCCRDKIIQTNPYEIARLARNRGQTTTEFRAGWTEDGEGTVLKRRDDGTCVFLTGQGCGVHPDRPLVCRLYPLGRHVTAEGVESWSHTPPHPQTEGDYTITGQISDYLVGQGARDFLTAVDEYAAWVRRAVDVLNASDASYGEPSQDERNILDMDAAIADHCASSGEAAPSDIEERKRLHLKILHASLDDFVRGEL